MNDDAQPPRFIVIEHEYATIAPDAGDSRPTYTIAAALHRRCNGTPAYRVLAADIPRHLVAKFLAVVDER